MPSSTDPDAPAANLAKAKVYYNHKQYPRATAMFKQVSQLLKLMHLRYLLRPLFYFYFIILCKFPPY